MAIAAASASSGSHPFIKSTYVPGDYLRCEACEGKVLKIDAAATHLRTEEATTIIPNRILADQIVTVVRNSSNASGKI